MPTQSKVTAEYAHLCGKFSTAPVKIRVTTSSNALGATGLTEGFHRICSDVSCHILQGGAPLDVDSANGIYVPADTIEMIATDGSTDNNIAVIGSGDGYLCITKMG
jgi:hypothetical protein